jgi:hypothetical protein
MTEFYEDALPVVNGLRRTGSPLEYHYHQEVPGSFLEGFFGVCFSSFQSARPACTTPYKASPLKSP